MWRSIVLAAVLVSAHAASARAAEEFTGRLASGAYYHVAIPEQWQPGDALVLYQHGLDFSDPDDPPGLGPLRGVMLAEGYAIAATSYSQRGWALFTAIDDNRDLLDRFEQIAGAPGEVVPYGGSMGGLVALKLAEAPGFPPVRGAYALCPAAAGARVWDAAIDLRLAFDVVCKDANAGEFPEGHAPLPWALDLFVIPDDLGDLFDQSLILPVLLPLNQCTGVNLPPFLRNDAMQDRLDELMTFANISDEDFFVTNMGYATYVMSELVRAPDKLGGENPFTTQGVDYSSDANIQANIARIVADPNAAAELHRVSDFGGAIGNARILSMHTSRDELVIPGNQDFVRARRAAGSAHDRDRRRRHADALRIHRSGRTCRLGSAASMEGRRAATGCRGVAGAMRSAAIVRRGRRAVPFRCGCTGRRVRQHRASARGDQSAGHARPFDASPAGGPAVSIAGSRRRRHRDARRANADRPRSARDAFAHQREQIAVRILQERHP